MKLTKFEFGNDFNNPLDEGMLVYHRSNLKVPMVIVESNFLSEDSKLDSWTYKCRYLNEKDGLIYEKVLFGFELLTYEENLNKSDIR